MMRTWTMLALIGMALAGGPTLAAPLPSAWMGDSRNGCKVWNPQPQPEESVRWSGACVAGFASGPGVTEWLEDGQVTESVEGGRVAGHLQGRGIQTLANGDRFEGTWKDDRREGPGTYTRADGKRVTGVWIADQLVSGPGQAL